MFNYRVACLFTSNSKEIHCHLALNYSFKLKSFFPRFELLYKIAKNDAYKNHNIFDRKENEKMIKGKV